MKITFEGELSKAGEQNRMKNQDSNERLWQENSARLVLWGTPLQT